MSTFNESITHYFPNCRRALGAPAWDRILSALGTSDPREFVRGIGDAGRDANIPPWLADAVRVEWQYWQLSQTTQGAVETSEKRMVNPHLALVPVSHGGLPQWLGYQDAEDGTPPELSDGHVLIWRHPETGEWQCRDAEDDDLLALKLVVEELDIREAARMSDSTPARFLAALYQAMDRGLILSPPSWVRREFSEAESKDLPESLLSAPVFTLQWHITQSCDLRCRHCYDRSPRQEMPLDEGVRILEDFFAFTQSMHVRGHVTFTGGNPLLYPDFLPLYQYAADMGFSCAILGNPADGAVLDAILEIQPLTHYQISLEGLEPYNDYIRGKGHFKRSLIFLDQLRAREIYAMVMLTLNRDNMDQVLALADVLRNRADGFTFNRLAMVGEGKQLTVPKPEDFQHFLAAYLAASADNPVMTLKDNLFNLVTQNCERQFDGCTGYGCGAAFNFVSLLPDGEVHACRKFSSLIGNVKMQSLADIYQGGPAVQYRRGPEECRGCDLAVSCRGCPAVVYGMGLDASVQRDPFCFYAHAPSGHGVS